MITVRDFMELCDFKITEGSDYTWECFGPDAYRLDSWNQEQEGHTVSIVFDTRTHEVYQVSAYDYSRNRAYRIINPDYKSQHDQEAQDRDVNNKEAWDDVDYVDLDVDEDFLEKARAIVSDLDYDTRVSVPLTLPDDSLFQLMKLAHQSDLTLNQYVEQLLRQAIDDEQFVRDLDTMRDDYDFADAEQGLIEESVKKIKKRKKSK